MANVLLRAVVGIREEVPTVTVKSVRVELAGGDVTGAVEKVVAVQGPVEEASQVLALQIARPVSDDTVRLRLAIPELLVPYVAGRQGVQLRTIAVQTGATLSLADTLLPLSTELLLAIEGSREQTQAATLQVGQVFLQEAKRLQELPSVPFQPRSIAGFFAHPDRLRMNPEITSQHAPYGVYPPPAGTEEALAAQAAAASALRAAETQTQATPTSAQVQGQPSNAQVTQQIFVPNDMIGAIIGKQGAKINEIRRASGCQIRISAEPTENTKERMITLSGSQEAIRLGLYLLYQRLESEK